jgi:transketolase
MLHLTGYDLSLDDLKQFRQWGSRTPGHPEAEHTPGVEVTTGPLGQGFGNSIGLAIAERWLAATFNGDGHEIVAHYTYVMASDGDIMEGLSTEAASLAGDLHLGRLTVLYDANRITLSASTDVSFTEDVGAKFAACGWHVQEIDGQDSAAVDAALTAARAVEDKPSLIVARTHIGYGSPNKQDTFHAHGEALGAEEVKLTKRAYGWPEDSSFLIPPEALAVFRAAVPRGAALEAAWRKKLELYHEAVPDMAAAFEHAIAGKIPEGWDRKIPAFKPSDGDMATRDAGNKVLDALTSAVPNLIGGSGDLDPSTKTMMKGLGDFQAPGFTPSTGEVRTQGLAGGVTGYAGRNMHFGIREHAMTAALTGMARHGGVIPFGATFLTFSDYMRPAIRLAALSKAHVVYVWTHDSIALGEDGPTHQPIEHLASLRAMPNVLILRPADATETAEAWKVAMANVSGPVGLVLTRQKLPVLDRSKFAPASGVAKGAYVLIDPKDGAPQVIVIATGSEVSIALAAHEQLAASGVRSRVVSMPSWGLFDSQPKEYRDSVLPPAITARVSVEAASPFGWERYVGLSGAIIGIDHFGASAPGPTVMREYGFTAEHIVEAAKAQLKMS